MYAAKNSRADVVRYLLDQEAKNPITEPFSAPIELAVLIRDDDIVFGLVEAQPEVLEASYTNSWDVLMHAMMQRDDKMKGQTMLMKYAKARFDPQILEMMVDYVFEDPGELIVTDTNGSTPLMASATAGCSKALGLLMEAGAFTEATNSDKETALHQAARKGHKNVIEKLVKHGKAGLDLKNTDNMTALRYAEQYERTDILELLKNAKPPEMTELMRAAAQGKLDDVKRLVGQANIEREAEATYLSNWTALMYAAKRGHTEVAKVLLPKATIPPLDRAAILRDRDVFKGLIDAGVDINGPDGRPWGQLSAAVMGDDLELVKLLCDLKADVNVKEKDDITPLYRAAMRGRAEMVDYLLERGAKIIPDKGKRTAIYRAAQYGHAAVLKQVLSRQENLQAMDTKDEDGLTPLMVAAIGGHMDAARVLRVYNADKTPTIKGFIPGLGPRSKRVVEAMRAADFAQSPELKEILL
ncbi:hypothetical protein GPECTOR_27g668 [Gonium pectorale]|uniref:Uncharacterized protein n=1 Tax=Gonium pectorale TaxID=33097 RepID=A0A150GFA2_GONPE|nr:hypothetical protein GPECTOR_27g668 [Gonium pectorale]|eukprot:KXZ48498.1 hypothetical protein GPECTOR_27g668 [Gonium pectorale]